MTSLPDTRVETRSPELWVDNLRVLVIAGVIVVHTATAYVVDIAGWYYEDERTTSELWSTLLAIPAFFAALFALGPLFLIAGWFSVPSIARRGPAGFARSRLLRLGVPMLVFVVLLQPLGDYVGNLWSEARSFVHYLGITELSVMWFAAALLAFSLVYAAWEHLHPGVARPAPLRPRTIVAAILAIAASSFAVWLVWPPDKEVFLNLRLPEWPQGAVLFALGVHAARAGWLHNLSGSMARRLGRMAGAGALGVMVFLAVAAPSGELPTTGANWPTMLFAILDGVIAVGFALWFVTWLQRRWPAHGELVARASRASYATYFIHPLVLTTIMVLLASLPLVPELKFLLVSAAAIPACFAAGYALTRLPGTSQVL